MRLSGLKEIANVLLLHNDNDDEPIGATTFILRARDLGLTSDVLVLANLKASNILSSKLYLAHVCVTHNSVKQS